MGYFYLLEIMPTTTVGADNMTNGSEEGLLMWKPYLPDNVDISKLINGDRPVECLRIMLFRTNGRGYMGGDS